MFSVVIPLYNKAQSITATLKSVLAQTFQDFEIVVVNDGSTDASLEVVKEMQEARIRIIDQENGGVSNARNQGIREAKNEWIAFLDGDDLWTDDHLEEFHKAIESSPQINWLFSGYTSINGSKSYPFIYKKYGKLENVFDDLLNGIKIHTSTVCVKKELFLENPELYFREGLNNSEDREVWYKLCLLDKSPYYIRKSLSVYKLDVPNSLTKTSDKNKMHYLSVYDRLLESDIFKRSTEEDKCKIKEHIENFNRKAINGYYLNNSELEMIFKNHLSSNRWFILSNTCNLAKLIKKIIIRL